MSKKRKCRYTPEELAIHEEAVKLRKMTDRQLVEMLHGQKADTEVCAERPTASAASSDEDMAGKDTNGVQTLLNELAEGKCKGVKGATVYKITEFAAGLGLI